MRVGTARVAGALALSMLSGAIVLLVAAPSSAIAANATSRFVAAPPCRLFDVRTGTGFERVDELTVVVQAAGQCGIPEQATAVAMTVTVDSNLVAGAGYVSVWPEGQPQPTASILNYFGGQVRANGAIVGIKPTGRIAVLASNAAPVLADVTGWFVPADLATEGRFVPIDPVRALDTRQAPVGRPMAAGETLTLPLPPGVPTDAAAVAVTLTLTESPGPGYFTLTPAGEEPSTTSVLNADAAMQTRAAGSIVAVSPNGIDLFSRSGGHAIVDVTGWFTGASAAEDDAGLFVAADAPRRLLDTRNGDPVWPDGTVEIPNVDPNAAALAINVALVNPMRATFVTASAARWPRPATSTVNAMGVSEIAASMAITPVSDLGLGLYTSGGADVVVDLAGWFTGTPVTGAGGPPSNTRPLECARSSEPADLTAFFASNRLFTGADYQRMFLLPDGRVLWLFQDMYVAGRYGRSSFVHNAGLLQTGNCFQLLTTGNYAAPGEYLLGDMTQRRKHWFWPLSGEFGNDGMFHLFMAEMFEHGATYLTKVEPLSTWRVRIDPVTLQVIDRQPATDPTNGLYGWSIESDADYTYLYGHCYRQFGWDAFPFVSPPVYIHDLSCSDEVRVARVPRGELSAVPQYWDGSVWQSERARAASIVPSGRMVSASQFYRVGNRWISITKVDDWFGNTVTIDVATRPQGPYTNLRTILMPAKCNTCNTYFAALLPWPTANGKPILAISNNMFDRLDLSRYQPSFLALEPF